MVDLLDLRIFKTLTSKKIEALTFAYTYNHDLFHEKLFAKLLLAYMRAFRNLATRRTMQEWTGGTHKDYLNSIWDQIDRFEYDTNEYNFDLEQLKQRYITETVESIKQCAAPNATQAVKDMSLKLQTIKIVQEGRSFTQETVKEHFEQFEQRYEAKAKDPTETDHILTHYSAMDDANGGFRPAELFLIGGETGAGKSMMLMNMAIQMWMQKNTLDLAPSEMGKGYNITYFSLEMPYDDCYTRFLARTARVIERHIIDGELSSDEQERIQQVKRFITEYPFEFDIIDVPRGLTIDEIELRYQDALLKYQPDVVIVDYMGLMHSPMHSKEPDWLKMGNIGGELHEFGRVYNVLMGSAVQLTDIQRNSNTDSKDKSEGQRVGVHRIGRSSQIMHHANMGIQIETRFNEDQYSDLRYHIIKNRRGPRKKGNMNKNLAMCLLTDKPYSGGQAAGPDSSDREPDISGQLSASQAARARIAERAGRIDE
jgi:replicative DNA helicase